MTVNGSTSNWAKVISGIPQGSVLGLLLLVLYINDLPDNVKSEALLFADDTNVYRLIKSTQDDIDSLLSWSDKWPLKFQPGIKVQGNQLWFKRQKSS